MDVDLKKILGEILSEENAILINQALEAKINEVREQSKVQAENELRGEYEAKYNEIKDELVETLGSFIDENLKKELLQYSKMRKDVHLERLNLSKQITESRLQYKENLKNHLAILEQFHNTILAKEIKELKESFNSKIKEKNLEIVQIKEQFKDLRKERHSLAEEKVNLIKTKQNLSKEYEIKLQEHCDLLTTKLDEQLKDHVVSLEEQRMALIEERNSLNTVLSEQKEKVKVDLSNRIEMLETFVFKTLENELRGLKKDKDALDSARIKLIAEGETKINQLKKNFITESSKKIQTFVDFNMRKQLTELKEDIEISRKNNFGRRIFESFIEEYLDSSLGKNSSIIKMQKIIESKEKELNKLNESLISSQHKIKEINESYQQILDQKQRIQTLNALLGPLNKDQKKIMEELLSSHNTNNLKEAFNRYWPRVENIGFDKKANMVDKPKVITESKTVDNDGYRHTNKLASSIKEESERDRISNAQVYNILKLAGTIDGAKK